MAQNDFYYLVENGGGNRIIKKANLDGDTPILTINQEGEIIPSANIDASIQIRRGIEDELATVILAEGELGYTTDTKRVYIGDGVTLGGSLITPPSVYENGTGCYSIKPIHGCNTASGCGSTVINGIGSTACGPYSTASGYCTTASGVYSTASGYCTIASGFYSIASGYSTTASGLYSIAGGRYSTACGCYSTASGYCTTASGRYSTASGCYSTVSGQFSTASGFNSTASGNFSTASGNSTTASGLHSTASGAYSTASGVYSTANGYYSTASGNFSTASGVYSTASGAYSTASGKYSTASGKYSTASGRYSTASGCFSTASGVYSTASGFYSTASGKYSTACGFYSIASGYCTIASGLYSTASGKYSTASGIYSTASGYYTLANKPFQHAIGINGKNQSSILQWFGSTNSTTTTEIFVGGLANQRAVISPYSVWHVTVSYVAVREDEGEFQAGTRQFIIKKHDINSSTQIVGTVQTIGTDEQTVTSPLDNTTPIIFSADTTNGSLKIEMKAATTDNTNVKVHAILNEMRTA